ncbi:MAG: hypothetical protein M1825_000554 [Sarcosagium campestre]|nr:MAG: hypothetical protein M1825_000554 [Sarcosagium campestre]
MSQAASPIIPNGHGPSFERENGYASHHDGWETVTRGRTRSGTLTQRGMERVHSDSSQATTDTSSETEDNLNDNPSHSSSDGNGALAPEHGNDSNGQRPTLPLVDAEKERVLKLSPAKIEELTTSPQSLALHAAPLLNGDEVSTSNVIPRVEMEAISSKALGSEGIVKGDKKSHGRLRAGSAAATLSTTSSPSAADTIPVRPRPVEPDTNKLHLRGSRPALSTRTVSSPLSARSFNPSSRNHTRQDQSTPSLKLGRAPPTPLHIDSLERSATQRLSNLAAPASPGPAPSPMPQSIPLPPLSIPTYLQLELSSSRPSPLYIHRSLASDFPYESSRIKFERLLNFLLLPPQLEQVLWFGALACLDSWLYTFTILPLRFVKALAILGRWWGSTLAKEAAETIRFTYTGVGRMWQRRRSTIVSLPALASSDDRADSRRPPLAKHASQTARSTGVAVTENGTAAHQRMKADRKPQKQSTNRHRRVKSTPSALMPDHKADLLKGLLVLISCMVLMRFDASRMYHGIRGQAAIKLYAIYNVLEVCDRLLSALGQDVLECLFSRETLERKPDGRSKVLRPFGMFLLALSYNVLHSTALFYQVMTLNVAVNSYSNALTTLLMSNQFVEIKSTVFKKFEKENLFQLTCADVVERFQLWLMLLIIALRNIVEVGGLSLGSSSFSPGGSSSAGGNYSSASPSGGGSIIPKSFTLFPKWTGQVMGPFLLVLGSEMLVDWLKHAYITKFNNTKPVIYGRFFDVLAKDYYSNAFADQNLTRRLGLPVIPLSCLFIRASVQTYHMFIATNIPLPIASTATSLSVDSATTSPATTAALQHFDTIIRRALGRSSYGGGGTTTAGLNPGALSWWSADDAIACVTMLIFFGGVFLILLAFKLVLGMVLLGIARSRYKGMKERERLDVGAGGRRIGGWGVVEVDDDKKRIIYQDDPEGARASREREKNMRERLERTDADFASVSRYNMVAKRIW